MKKKGYICSFCGARFIKWQGQCSRCGHWGTLEEIKESSPKNDLTPPLSEIVPVSLKEISKENIKFLSSGSTIFDQFLGKGMVAGSVILFAGEPGVGKSTFLMQLLSGFIKSGLKGLYVSGEESLYQLKLRADRLGICDEKFKLLCTQDLSPIISIMRDKNSPNFIVIDSIQTIKSPQTSGSVGGVSQIKEVASKLYEEAKKKEIVVLIVSHITKEGQIAGPKLLEHMVDVVLYMEGDRLSSYRLLKITKNRFGPSNNILVLEMESEGLKIVKDPSTFFLTSRDLSASGSSLVMAMEGKRPFVIEIQALVTKGFGQNPRRTALGIDLNRLYLLIAILEKRLALRFYEMDVYVKISAGIKISDPAMDLGICSALISSYFDIPVPDRAIFWGEVDLNGFIRPSFGEEKRLSQANNLNFSKIICPRSKYVAEYPKDKIFCLSNIKELTSLQFYNK